ncbi:MAG: phosphoribosylformylglycinamidine synthase [bacterium]|nr:phosphoribosylformylglycinamidine synthase [bacterium]
MKETKGTLLDFYRSSALSNPEIKKLVEKTRSIFPGVESIKTEFQFLVDSTRLLTAAEQGVLQSILSVSYEPEGFGNRSFFDSQNFIVPTGTRLSRVSPWSTRMVAVCHSSGLTTITRLERIRRHKFTFKDGVQPDREIQDKINLVLHDFMTEQVYPNLLKTFDTNVTPEKTMVIDVLGQGYAAIEKANADLGANLGKTQLRHLYDMSLKYGENPTDVFLFQCGQGISEHSRHPWFNARQEIDGILMPDTPMELIKSTVLANSGNSLSHFHDNSSVISGFETLALRPANPLGPSPYIVKRVRYCFTFNGETHNYPTSVNSVPGSETGTGGRVRDNLATGRGGLIIAGTTVFMVGYLFIPGYDLPWEIKYGPDPKGLEIPLDILWGAHSGSYDYGNKIGEPVICGSTRSHEMMLSAVIDGEEKDFWSGYRKTIMFTGGIGQMDEELIEGRSPEKGMLLFRFGGNASDVGTGGAGRSSDELKEDKKNQAFDKSGVQRGDAIMEKLGINVVRACVELWPIFNPSEKFHDSGAGGASNCGPEALFPAGGTIFLNRIPTDDKTMGQRVYWTNECQEVIVVLIRPENKETFLAICEREECPIQEIGYVTGDGIFILHDERDGSTPVKFNMEEILGKGFPQDTNVLKSVPLIGKPFAPPADLSVMDALDRTLRLIDVGSKRTLINKVDRSVSGLIAQQQTVGPCQLPLADFGVVANSMLQKTGAAISIGEQPIYGLIDPGAMVRMSVAEMFLNLAGAKFKSIEEVNICGNWMFAVKVPGEGVRLFNGVEAATRFVKELRTRINSGKDSLNMACETMVKDIIKKITSPGTFIASAYVPMADVTKKVTPDIKRPGFSRLMYLDIAKGKTRMGGSVLGRVFNMLGAKPPDIDDVGIFVNALLFVQELIEKELIMAYHDRSDGGIIQTVLEMAFAGNCGIKVNLNARDNSNLTALKTLFNQEAGYVFEFMPRDENAIRSIAKKYKLNTWLHNIGRTGKKKNIAIQVNSEVKLRASMLVLRDIWETTGFKIEGAKGNSEIVEVERQAVYDRPGMKFKADFKVRATPLRILRSDNRPRIGIFRNRGSNSDREMANAFYLAGFEPWDINMDDLKKGKISLEVFRMIAYVGGFSDGDVPGAGVGWASAMLNHQRLRKELKNFCVRPDTIGFYECNGAQVSPQIGVVPWPNIPWSKQPRFIWGDSHKFESRFVSANLLESPCVFTQGMEGSTLGIWVANGEGKLFFPDRNILNQVIELKLSPIRYADDNLRTTEQYPFNPSGGEEGRCSLCSIDGRHLALMPHVVRSCLTWQWAYTPWGWRKRQTSLWMKFLQNGYEYLANNLDLSEKPSAKLLKYVA